MDTLSLPPVDSDHAEGTTVEGGDTNRPAVQTSLLKAPQTELDRAVGGVLGEEIVDGGADARVVPSRGVVVTNADYKPVGLAEVFGPQSFHNGDYTLFYNNIKDNVAKRIAAYQGSTK